MVIKNETKRVVSERLKLNTVGEEQDWELELADQTRIDDFISFMINNQLSDDEKYAVMALIVASYDDFLDTTGSHDLTIWSKIKDLVNADNALYQDLLLYWSLKDDKEGDDVFSITASIRKLL